MIRTGQLRAFPLLLLVACTRQSDSQSTLAEMTIVCTAYKHAAHVAGSDTVTGELRQWHQQADRVCADAEKRTLQAP